MSSKGFKRTMVAVAFGAFSSMASAALITTVNDANDCAGAYGANFNDCRIPAEFDQNQTPIIIKFDFSDNGTITSTEIATLFPSITGNEFTFDFGTDGTGDGSWTYNPGPGDPAINFFVAKGGNNFNLFSNDGDPLTDTWFTPLNNGGQTPNLSHLSFYDTGSGGGGNVPEPMPLALLGAGLLGLVLVGRRRSS